MLAQLLPCAGVELPAGKEHHHSSEQPERVAQARVFVHEEHVDHHDDERKDDGHLRAAFGLLIVQGAHFLNALHLLSVTLHLLLVDNEFVARFLHSLCHLLWCHHSRIVGDLCLQAREVAYSILHALHLLECAFGVHGAVGTHESLNGKAFCCNHD